MRCRKSFIQGFYIFIYSSSSYILLFSLIFILCFGSSLKSTYTYLVERYLSYIFFYSNTLFRSASKLRWYCWNLWRLIANILCTKRTTLKLKIHIYIYIDTHTHTSLYMLIYIYSTCKNFRFFFETFSCLACLSFVKLY